MRFICCAYGSYFAQTRCVEFAAKREKAVATNEQLQAEAQIVLDVIENPDVAQALRQDKIQNLQYLKEHYNVRPFLHSTLMCFEHSLYT